MNHTNRILSLTLAGLLSAAATSAVAQSTASDFKTFDSNADGKISKEEFKAQGGQDDAFRQSDADGDNSLSAEELMGAGTTTDGASGAGTGGASGAGTSQP